MGLFDRVRGSSANQSKQPEPWPEFGSILDTVPAADARALSHQEWWIRKWLDLIGTEDNAALATHHRILGEAVGSNGLHRVVTCHSTGLAPADLRQRPWRWLGLGAQAARQNGDSHLPIRLFYFMLSFEDAIGPAIEMWNTAEFTDLGYTRPSAHSQQLLAKPAYDSISLGDADASAFTLPNGQLNPQKLLDRADRILRGDFGSHEPQHEEPIHDEFQIGPPLSNGVFADAASGQFLYGRRINS